MTPLWVECHNIRLSAVWRRGAADEEVWVLCPPFAEEEKSARHIFTQIVQRLQRGGHSSLIFSFSGTGDSEGDFSQASLEQWQREICYVCDFAQKQVAGAKLHLLGLRLGASLAALAAAQINPQQLLLLEPVLNGATFLERLSKRKQLRGMLTDGEKSTFTPKDIEDLDGWPLGQAMKRQLEELQLANLELPPSANIWQIGPRREVKTPLKRWAEQSNITPKVLLMPPFWNRLDNVSAQPLLDALEIESGKNLKEGFKGISASRQITPGETPVLIQSSNRQLVGTFHLPPHHKSTFILMLHGWSGTRSGPHQMLTRAARRFADAGYGVLRFDFNGRGDSDGDADLATLATMKEDTEASLQYIQKYFPQSRVILSGLCSGCEVAFAAASHKTVDGMMLWSAPVFAATASAQRTSQKRRNLISQYLHKATRISTWKKVLKGDWNPSGVQKVLSHKGGESKNIESNDPGQLPVGWRQDILDKNQQLNIPIKLIFGDADPTAAEAQQWYKSTFPKSCTLDITHISGANHSYYGLDWERQVLENSVEWLKKYFCE